MPNTQGHARLGLVVGKKTAKRSVARNYMKRTLRELFRHEMATLGAVDIVLRPLMAYSRTDFAKVQSELISLLEKLRKRGGA